MTARSTYRLPTATLDALDALAVPHSGNRTAALKDAVACWRRVLAEAGRLNAAELSAGDWVRLGHLNDPGSSDGGFLPPGIEDDDERTHGPLDWSSRLAHELAGRWEGRTFLPALHGADREADYALAKRIADCGFIRGYALWSALRVFWTREESPDQWWAVEEWMTPEVRPDAVAE